MAQPQSRAATQAGQSPAPSPDVAGRQAEPWEYWPQSCRNFVLAVDDANDLCSTFCADLKCRSCDPQEALHVSVFNGSGTLISDGKVNCDELEAHLSSVGELGSHAGRADEPRYRLYFTSNTMTEDCIKTAYMRRLLSHYHTPVDIALTCAAERLSLGFRVFHEVVGGSNGAPSSRVLHLCLKYAVHLRRDDLKSDLEYFSDRIRNNQVAKAERTFTSIQDPAVCISYDVASGQCAAWVTEHGTVFRALRQTCQDAVRMHLNDDPFVLLVVFLQCVLNATRRTAVGWREHIYGLARVVMSPQLDKRHRSKLLAKLNRDRLAYARITDTMQSIVQDIHEILEQHAVLVQERNIPADIAGSVNQSLKAQRATASQLIMIVRGCQESCQSYIDIILGYSQLKNSYATEALAVDARRDTQTMKTITYVTLIFLPSTFVSTVFSMGIFNFDTDMQSDGHVTISKHGWIFLAVSLPLTLLTIAFAYLWMRIKGNSTPAVPDDEEALDNDDDDGELTNFVVRRKGKDGIIRDVPLSSIPLKEMTNLFIALRQRLKAGRPTGTRAEPVGIYVRMRRKGGDPERIPIEAAVERDSPEMTNAMIDLLEKIEVKAAKVGSTPAARRSLFHPLRRAFHFPPGDQSDVAARQLETPTRNANTGSENVRLSSHAVPVRGGIHSGTQGRAHSPPAAPAVPQPASPRADRSHFGPRVI